MTIELTEQTFLLYAAKHYDGSRAFDDAEFEEDLKRIKYIKRLLKKYIQSGQLKHRLILNHIIIMNNMFGPRATVKMLLLKLQGFEAALKPFLEYISILPHTVSLDGRTINTVEITSDPNVVAALNNLDDS